MKKTILSLIPIILMSSCGGGCRHHSGGASFDQPFSQGGHAYRDAVKAALYCSGEAYDEGSGAAQDAPDTENKINRGEIDSVET